MSNNTDIAWVKFRLPAELHAWLKGEATENFRSISAEILLAITERRKKVEGGGRMKKRRT